MSKLVCVQVPLRSLLGRVVALGSLALLTARMDAGEISTAENAFSVKLPPPPFPEQVLPNSPFGVNTALDPDAPDLEARLQAMQQAGIKWGRQDFTWKRIEKKRGEYDWEPYDRLVERCMQHGLLLFGDLTHGPDFYDS
jgi:hypothetical protein